MTLYWFPLEPLEERYTADWAGWFPRVFNENDIDFKTIWGQQLTSKIEQGEFLDICGRPYFAMSQLMEFIRLIKAGEIKPFDTLLFADLWHHGIEAAFYINDLLKKDLEIYGVFHAGSYDPEDFLNYAGTDLWARPFEESVINGAKGIFVGSDWSKQLLENICDRWNYRKIHVTGLPIDYSSIRRQYDPQKKLPRVVFPHRLAPEKGIGHAISIMDAVFAQDDEIKFVITTGRDELSCRDEDLLKKFTEFEKKYEARVVVLTGLTKGAYYHILNKCSVMLSTSKQETFGYGTVESMALGVTPVCPNRLSYADILQSDKRLIYKDTGDAVKKVLKYAHKPIDVSEYAKKYDLNNTIGKMLEEMNLV